MKPSIRVSPAFAAIALLALAAVARSHEDPAASPEAETMAMSMGASSPAPATGAEPTHYYQLQKYSSLMLAHILLMTIGWVFVLPVGVMLSIARSRFSLLAQFAFLALNSVAVFLVTIYNAKTPDLYPNNAHHKLGWLLTWVVSAQVVMAVITRYTGRQGSKPDTPLEERESFIPVSTSAMAEHQRIHDLRSGNFRFSNDSGQGTEPNTESLRSQSISSGNGDEENMTDMRREYEDEPFQPVEKPGILRGSRMDRFLSNKLPGLLSSRALQVFHLIYDSIDRVILILGFVALMTGWITYGGIFMGQEVFSGLAHFIKGGIFFWYGVLTLGRWAGAFANLGWAWNIKPTKAQKANRPSAEFVESFLIFFYGSTNVFLEHLAAWGKEWSPQDLEHLSITIMFIGGGLCGMLIESHGIRDLLNATVSQSPSPAHLQFSEDNAVLEQPKSYRVSMNPLPALIVLLLGLMMSSHHQHSMISTMVHKQWGNLLVGAAFARALTYVIFYLAPPTSIFPGRPPSELITAFCLMAGGTIFMTSAKDTVSIIETNNLDAMFIFTVTMGVITFLMAWIVLVIAIKGWAVRKERRSTFAY
ncbi:integral membrane protein-3 [Coleophoma cylindrospora]|uniref:Integral membrane protein-3 n=1 Tax=Coleophoma cylindrospora TaxID=1849047 RepID=A0A3D8R241_9HELO|nr:integral membrane protein-3 [Coleophoma cylindrospora]